MAVCEQRSLHLNDGRLLVSSNQLDGGSTDTLGFLWQMLFQSFFRWAENFGQSVKGTLWKTQQTHVTQLSLTNGQICFMTYIYLFIFYVYNCFATQHFQNQLMDRILGV